MGRLKLKKAPALGKSIKLPIAAETKFPSVKSKISTDVQQGGINIVRVFAKGGFVVTQYEDHKKGKFGQMMATPGEALRRAQTLTQMPQQYVKEGLVQAIIDAAYAARNQTIEGGNPIFNQNKDLLNVGKQMQMITKEIREEREKDPLLDEEMKNIEKEHKVKKA